MFVVVFADLPIPIGSVNSIFADIYHKNQPNAGKYTPSNIFLFIWVIFRFTCKFFRVLPSPLILWVQEFLWKISSIFASGPVVQCGGRHPASYVRETQGHLRITCEEVQQPLGGSSQIHRGSLAVRPSKMMVGRLLSFWDGLFSGAMLNFQGVVSS